MRHVPPAPWLALLLTLPLARPVLAQGYSQGASIVRVRPPVQIGLPDGGADTVNIGTAPRLDTNITNEYVPVAGDSGGGRLQVEATGPLNAPIAVTGAGGNPVYVTGPGGGPVVSELGQQTANLITNPSCTFGVPQITTIGTTPIQLPSVAESHAEPTTKWSLLNLSKTHRVCCQGIQPDGGVPDCTSKGYVAEEGGGGISLDGQQTLDVYCRTNTGTAEVNVWEASCVQ